MIVVVRIKKNFNVIHVLDGKIDGLQTKIKLKIKKIINAQS
jgi:hypothetical protein